MRRAAFGLLVGLTTPCVSQVAVDPPDYGTFVRAMMAQVGYQ